jgi:hypothetical protein
MYMRIRVLLFTPVLVGMAILGVNRAPASAATLYTTFRHIGSPGRAT